ncbi:MAG: tetratricopeptide repeat protein [Paracoccaceae bacterium]
MRLIFATLALAFPLVASACPDAPDRSADMAALIDAARAAPTEQKGREIGQKMWEIWATAPDEEAQAILDRGLTRLSGYDRLGAISDFDKLIAYCPDYAEGHNQRAFAYFLSGDFEEAVLSLHRALALNPTHVAARAGLALSFLQLGELEKARVELLGALELNPWLSERALLAPGGALEPTGKDI